MIAAAKKHFAERWPELTFAGVFGVAIVADLWLVFSGRESISARCWDATQAHPTLIAAGVLASPGVGWLLRKSWPAVLVWGMLAGHLFCHW